MTVLTFPSVPFLHGPSLRRSRRAAGLAALAVAAVALAAARGAAAHGDGHATAPAAVASQAHGDPADPAHDGAAAPPVQTAWGRAGDPRRVQRTVTIRMDDAMRFAPSRLHVKLGQTVRLVIRNDGRLMHELVLGSRASIAAHAEQMARQPDMPHGGADMAHVPPGKSAEIVWTFNRAGTVHFACLVDGHHLAGMVGTIEVVR